MIKNAWITEHEGSVVALSIESEDVYPEYKRIRAESSVFPEIDAETHPQRHVLVLSVLELDDLYVLRGALNKYIMQHRTW